MLAILFKTSLNLAKQNATGAEAVRLFAVKLWRDGVKRGANVEYIHNQANTQTLAVVGYPFGYLQNIISEQPSLKLDLSTIQPKFLAGANYEAVDLEADATFKAVFAKYLEKQGSAGPKCKV